ncbi:CIC11C00000003178 [Sungouiella intermedia]|uniref:CIC11C00000003178 n=1 Tax=Sungouiella intermedia TaxID=45354 RepID=A0A1L0BDD1_9ASCO|nr:CIC11C00000003178 [[Candida] intermedia]
MSVTSLNQEEMDAILYDAREGDLEFLKLAFPSIIPGLLLPSVKDSITLSTPIHMAAGNGHLEVMEFFLSLVSAEQAAELVRAKNDSGNTALHWAAFNGHLPVVKALVEKYGADVFDKNSSGHDAIFEAENGGQEEVENWFLLKFAIEDDIKVDDSGEDTKITYTPGSESQRLDDEASEAAKNLAAEKKDVADVESQTAKLEL